MPSQSDYQSRLAAKRQRSRRLNVVFLAALCMMFGACVLGAGAAMPLGLAFGFGSRTSIPLAIGGLLLVGGLLALVWHLADSRAQRSERGGCAPRVSGLPHPDDPKA